MQAQVGRSFATGLSQGGPGSGFGRRRQSRPPLPLADAARVPAPAPPCVGGARAGGRAHAIDPAMPS
eukprot:9988815-Lingulodinium_polyedra.AAC.1